MAKVPESEIYKYLTQEKGIPHKHAMGILTNIIAESNLNPSVYELGADPDTAGIGLFQYTFPERREEFVKKVPDWESNWKAQIDFALSEPETKAYLQKDFETEADAVKDFTINWERPANPKQKAEERVETYLPQAQSNLADTYNPVDSTLDPAAQALGLPTSTEIQDNAIQRFAGYENMTNDDIQRMYQGLLEADAAALAAGEPPALVSQEFESGPQALQFLARRMQGGQEFSNLLPEVVVSADDIDKDEPFTVDDFNLGAVTDAETDAAYNRARQKEFIENPSGNYNNPDVRPEDSNFLSKLKGQDYMGLLTDIGAYAARMAPLSRALASASSYDEERYPRFSPKLPTAYAQKRDVSTAFNTAREAAMQQGKLDLGALSALATQQAIETARVEENVANERIGLLNQAQQLNNQITMQEMADTAANKGAAQTMQYQALAAMSEIGQGSLREANMRRNDKIVKEMFESVFDELKEIKSSIG